MLQDLMEMKNKGWKTRRKEETAKTIEQIHKEAAKEERAMKKRGSSSNLQRMSSRSSSGDMRNLSQRSITDADGFTTVSKGSGISRSVSSSSLRRSGSTSSNRGKNDGSSKPKLKKSTSGGSFGMLRDTSAGAKKDKSTKPPTDAKPKEKPQEKKEYKDPQACGKSSISILKEYFVGGDTDEAVLSIFELIGSETEDGALERGIAVIESSCGHVLESKAEDVDKYLTVLTQCVSEKKLSAEMLEGGFSGLLEFLSDIIIDAPLAGAHMSKIVGTFIKSETLKLDFLLSTPEYFRIDGKAAQFAAKVMKSAGSLEDASCVEVVEKLMTEGNREEYKTVQDLIGSI